MCELNTVRDGEKDTWPPSHFINRDVRGEPGGCAKLEPRSPPQAGAGNPLRILDILEARWVFLDESCSYE